MPSKLQASWYDGLKRREAQLECEKQLRDEDIGSPTVEGVLENLLHPPMIQGMHQAGDALALAALVHEAGHEVSMVIDYAFTLLPPESTIAVDQCEDHQHPFSEEVDVTDAKTLSTKALSSTGFTTTLRVREDFDARPVMERYSADIETCAIFRHQLLGHVEPERWNSYVQQTVVASMYPPPSPPEPNEGGSRRRANYPRKNTSTFAHPPGDFDGSSTFESNRTLAAMCASENLTAIAGMFQQLEDTVASRCRPSPQRDRSLEKSKNNDQSSDYELSKLSKTLKALGEHALQHNKPHFLDFMMHGGYSWGAYSAASHRDPHNLRRFCDFERLLLISHDDKEETTGESAVVLGVVGDRMSEAVESCSVSAMRLLWGPLMRRASLKTTSKQLSPFEQFQHLARDVRKTHHHPPPTPSPFLPDLLQSVAVEPRHVEVELLHFLLSEDYVGLPFEAWTTPSAGNLQTTPLHKICARSKFVVIRRLARHYGPEKVYHALFHLENASGATPFKFLARDVAKTASLSGIRALLVISTAGGCDRSSKNLDWLLEPHGADENLIIHVAARKKMFSVVGFLLSLPHGTLMKEAKNKKGETVVQLIWDALATSFDQARDSTTSNTAADELVELLVHMNAFHLEHFTSAAMRPKIISAADRGKTAFLATVMSNIPGAKEWLQTEILHTEEHDGVTLHFRAAELAAAAAARQASIKDLQFAISELGFKDWTHPLVKKLPGSLYHHSSRIDTCTIVEEVCAAVHTNMGSPLHPFHDSQPTASTVTTHKGIELLNFVASHCDNILTVPRRCKESRRNGVTVSTLRYAAEVVIYKAAQSLDLAMLQHVESCCKKSGFDSGCGMLPLNAVVEELPDDFSAMGVPNPPPELHQTLRSPLHQLGFYVATDVYLGHAGSSFKRYPLPSFREAISSWFNNLEQLCRDIRNLPSTTLSEATALIEGKLLANGELEHSMQILRFFTEEVSNCSPNAEPSANVMAAVEAAFQRWWKECVPPPELPPPSHANDCCYIPGCFFNPFDYGDVLDATIRKLLESNMVPPSVKVACLRLFATLLGYAFDDSVNHPWTFQRQVETACRYTEAECLTFYLTECPKIKHLKANLWKEQPPDPTEGTNAAWCSGPSHKKPKKMVAMPLTDLVGKASSSQRKYGWFGSVVVKPDQEEAHAQREEACRAALKKYFKE